MKRSLVFALLVLSAVLASLCRSAPVWYYPQRLTQPDGSVVNCYASGDEFNHWLHDANNYTIVQDPTTGYFVYALLHNGDLVPSDYVVGKVDPRSVGLVRGVHQLPSMMTERQQRITAITSGTKVNAPTAGVLNNIVIFIRFAGEAQEVFPDPPSMYDGMYNSPVAGANSMYNYYEEVSYGQLAISTTFYPVWSSNVLSYQDIAARNYFRSYNQVTNPIGYTSEYDAVSREQAMLKRAINAVASQVPSGLNIDGNSDGYVDNVGFILSGDAEAWSEWVLWPHSGTLVLQSASINGILVRGYDIEFRGFLLQEGRGVGTLCHEMFHTLGAPDLYNYGKHLQPDELFPVWTWDIMGCRNPPNPVVNPPPHMGAYMKYTYGKWIASIPTISGGTYALAPLQSPTGNCFKVLSPYSTKEYFVLEYRKKSGTFEQSLPGEGLLVYRINTSLQGNSNGPPDEVYVYRPGGTITTNGIADSAAFSANSGRTSMTDATDPSSFLSSGMPGGLRLTDVGSIGETISFTLVETSVADEATELPKIFSLAQNYPNPFNPSTVIKYTIGGTRDRGLGGRDVSLIVYDVLGREVAVLVNERKAPGDYEVRFDASGLSTGIYFYRLTAGQFVQAKKMLVVN